MKNDIDKYISESHDFAKPILSYFRKFVHKNCPAVDECLKWGFPHFQYKGILCSMASFNHHCAIGFWKGPLIPELKAIEDDSAMGQLGKITSVKDLPSDKVLGIIIKKAMKLNEEGVKSPTRSKPKSLTEIKVPDYLLQTIKKNKKAFETFSNFSNSNKKEYVEWVEDAKTEATKLKRIGTMLQWLAEGKDRNWKYKK